MHKDFHCKDEMVMRAFCLQNENIYTGKTNLYIETAPILSFIVKTIAADVLATQGARASVAKVLT